MYVQDYAVPEGLKESVYGRHDAEGPKWFRLLLWVIEFLLTMASWWLPSFRAFPKGWPHAYDSYLVLSHFAVLGYETAVWSARGRDPESSAAVIRAREVLQYPLYRIFLGFAFASDMTTLVLEKIDLWKEDFGGQTRLEVWIKFSIALCLLVITIARAWKAGVMWNVAVPHLPSEREHYFDDRLEREFLQRRRAMERRRQHRHRQHRRRGTRVPLVRHGNSSRSKQAHMSWV